MNLRKLLLGILVMIAMAGVIYIAAGLFLPSPRRLILGVDKRTGEVRMVRDSITFLPWHRFYRLAFERREGTAQTSGSVLLNTRDEVPVSMHYHLRFDVASERLPDTETLVREGWSEWIRSRVREAVAAVTDQVPVEAFAAPHADLEARRAPLRQTVERHLTRSGISVTSFEIERFDVDRESLLRLKRAELRRKARGTFSRVAVFGIDGADWELIRELVQNGRMPNIAALIDGGTTGILQGIQPAVSPLLWTTMATGVPPDRHGILDYFDRRGEETAVDSRHRVVPSVWEIANAFGRSSATVSWWTGWPGSNYSGVVLGTPAVWLDGAVHPPELRPRADAVVTPEDTVGLQQISRFVNISKEQLEGAVSRRDPEHVALLRSALSKEWSSHRAGLEIYEATRPTLLMKMFEGTDWVNHLYGPYHPPYRETVNYNDYRRFWPAVTTYYAEIDRMLGEWRQTLDPETTIIVVSAHGMVWGRGRPRTPPVNRISLGEHRTNGIFIAWGETIAPSRLRRPLSIFDIAPTILTLLGLPKSAEMPGEPISWAFRDVYPVAGIDIESYHDIIEIQSLPGPSVDLETYRKRLRGIGHIGDPDRIELSDPDEQEAITAITQQQWGLYAYLNNRAVSFRSEEQLRDAANALERAIETNPRRATPYLNLAMVLLEQERYTQADETFVRAVEVGLPGADQYFLDFAAWYREKNMPTRAINILMRARQLYPENHRIAASLGALLVSVNRLTEGQSELERALSLQPASTLVLNNLGMLYARRNDYGRALDLWNRSLSIDSRQPDIRRAAEAARTRL